MNAEQLKALLMQVKNDDTSVEDALEQLKELPYHDLEYAKVCLLYTSPSPRD